MHRRERSLDLHVVGLCQMLHDFHSRHEPLITLWTVELEISRVLHGHVSLFRKVK